MPKLTNLPCWLIPAFLALSQLTPADAIGQCQMQWLRSDPPNGTVRGLTRTANGDLVACGHFTAAGGRPAIGVARWDGRGWWPMGTGLTWNSGANLPDVRCLVTMPNGTVIAGGQFHVAGTVSVRRLARWDGYAWQPFGAGIPSGVVSAMAVLGDGSLLVGGTFTSVDGVPANGLARWDGTTWSQFGGGVSAASSIEVLANGNVVVGGEFATIGGVTANRVAEWNGTTWLPRDLTLAPYHLTPPADLAVFGSALVAGLPMTGTSPAVLTWNGSAWTRLGGNSGPAGTCRSLAIDGAGGLLASGTMTLGGTPANLVRWNGSTWSIVGGGLDAAARVMVPDPSGQVILGGEFTTAGGQPNPRIALWDGTHWGRLGEGFSGTVVKVRSTPEGRLFAKASTMTSGRGVGNIPTLRGLAWEDSDWPGHGWELGASGDTVHLVSSFTAMQCASWSNGSWTTQALPPSPTLPPPGSSGPGARLSTRVGTDGDQLVVCSYLLYGLQTPWLEVLRRTASGGWLQSTITSPGTGGVPYVCDAGVIAWLEGSSPVARISVAGGSGIETAMGMPFVLAATDWGGNKVVAGDFTSVSGTAAARIARYVGPGNWLPVGGGTNGIVRALAVLHDGRLVAGGDFTQAGGAAIPYLAVFDGTTWSAVPGGGTNGPVHTLHVMADGTLVVGGSFTQAGGQPAENLAFLGRICPSSLQPAGAGCSGSAGPLVLTALNEPWQGTQFRTRTTGFGPLAFGYATMGFTAPGTPLNLIHPAGGPGCLLHADPMVAHLLLPVAGVADAALAMPRSSVWLGVPFHHQVLQLEIDALGGLAGLSGSNGIRLVVGMP